MKIKTNVKAGGWLNNHNQTVSRGLKVKTSVKAGGGWANHNQTVARGLREKTTVKACASYACKRDGLCVSFRDIAYSTISEITCRFIIIA
jgi:hypothetical protein